MSNKSNIDYSDSADYDVDINVLPPNAAMLNQAEVVYDNARYVVKDIHLPDKDGNPIYTISITNLHSGKQTRGHTHHEYIEIFRFEKGRGTILLNGRTTHVGPNTVILVHKDVHHRVTNPSETEDLVYTTYANAIVHRENTGKNILYKKLD